MKDEGIKINMQCERPRVVRGSLLDQHNVLLRQIKRLQDRNRLLAEVVADERRMRHAAYKWYQDRLASKWAFLFDSVWESMKGFK